MIFNILNMICKTATMVMYIIGAWKLFEKLKVRTFWSIIPFGREYHIAKSIDMEDEAIIWYFTKVTSDFGYFFTQVFTQSGREDSLANTILNILVVVFGVINLIYGIRIFRELSLLFGMPKKWTIAWLIFPRITCFYWGVSKKILPVNQRIAVSESTVMAAGESGYVAPALESGLTININSRQVKNFLTKKTLLKDIHLNIEPGNMVLLLGGSGAGKTTFINAVNGYEKADATILLNGINVYEKFDKMKYEIGFVPQQDLIRYDDTVFKTLSDAASLRLPLGTTRSAKLNRINKVMNLFGLNSVKDNIVRKQSGGQKKRISIASEFISNPSLFILDEPDSGLDGILARELMERLHEISRQGKIVIVITHTPDRVIDLFDKVIVLGKDRNRTGRLCFYGSIDEAKSFFGKEKMEDIVRMINREDEGGEGKADELIEKYAEVRNGK